MKVSNRNTKKKKENDMKKAISLLLAVVMIFALCACGSSTSATTSDSSTATSETASSTTSSTEPEYSWKLAMPFNEGSSTYDAAKVFADTLEEVSGGKVHVDLYPGSQLGTSEEVEEGLAYGTCDVVFESIASLGNWSDLANLDAYPYLYSSLDHFLAVWQGELGDQIREEIGASNDFKLIGALYRGARIVTSTKELDCLADFKNFKIRTPTQAMYVKTWEALGAMSTPLPMSDVFTAIQQGTVDGQENPIAESYNYGFYDICPYVIKTNHVYSQCTFIFNKTKFDALPEEVQGWVEEAVKAAEDYKNTYTVTEEAEYYAKWEEAGATIIEVDVHEFMDALSTFCEDNFPQFTEYVAQIKALDPDAA